MANENKMKDNHGRNEVSGLCINPNIAVFNNQLFIIGKKSAKLGGCFCVKWLPKWDANFMTGN